jgi:hypothetical protein
MRDKDLENVNVIDMRSPSRQMDGCGNAVT